MSWDVVVVGAGPTGATVAGLLGRRGLRVLVLDRADQLHPLPRAVHLDDEVLRVFGDLGVGPAVRAISTPVPGMRLVNRAGDVLVEFPRDPTGGTDGLPGANLFHQPDLERVLRDELARQPSVELRTGVEVVDADPVTGDVRLADGQVVRGHYVLACDGAGGPVRRGLGIGSVVLGRSSTWLVTDVRTSTELPLWPGVHQVCDPERAATAMRVGPLRYRFEFAVAPGEAPEVHTLLAPWLADGPAWELERAATYTYRARVAQRWRVGRVLLLGDAAHLTPPFLGQGMCAGIRDAANLEWKLALVLGGAADETLLDSYQAERRPHATTVIRTAVALGAVLSTRGPARDRVRTVALRMVARIPGLSRRIAERAWPPLRRGPLVQRRGGRRAPTPEVRTADGIRRLDQVLGCGFAVLGPDVLPGETELAPGVGMRRVRLVAGEPGPGEVHDPTGGLDRWVRGRTVLVRPDHAVLGFDQADPAVFLR